MISVDSYATFRGCNFNDLELTVEVFDLSYGGRLRLEDCTFRNVQLGRNPPKYVSTTLNDDLVCMDPLDDLYKYHAEDDDDYDIELQRVDASDPSKGLNVQSDTISDCLRAVHLCVFICLTNRFFISVLIALAC